MATVTRYIYSHYDPQDREALEIETGQESSSSTRDALRPQEPEDEADPWQTESAFGAQRRLAAAPRFVPAAVSYDEVNNMLGGFRREVLQPPMEEPKSDLGGWYRSLTSGLQGKSCETTRPFGAQPSAASTGQSVPPQFAASSTSQPATIVAQPRPDKNNWFITRALRSEPSSAPPTPSPTLADILAREPPPSASKPFKPPVFLALGPSNRGWTMLQQKGWSEGEGLGASVPRRFVQQTAQQRSVPASRKGKMPMDRVYVKMESQEVRLDAEGDISEVRKVEVMDLTLSDSEDEGAEEEEGDDVELPPSSTSAPSRSTSPHSTPLLTPIPTILKSDRLGIGLKAKTFGPHKASKKRVTHNQAALAAHIRASEETRRLKAKVGRGSRSFARLAKADSEQRRQLLASLNEG